MGEFDSGFKELCVISRLSYYCFGHEIIFEGDTLLVVYFVGDLGGILELALI